ncbi:sensor histidine kinase [Arcobacter porcinus]|uniref:histidine kinase n=1 Tax=Arcobacter porcinus TaxID=1935204 RepID=A0A1C0B048_9BACT|nr:HAMP domain-containing sensor histidine kinase [Arcobacter porcinus]OCL82112.1 Sensor protein FixL [Arcobacter porcinus]OCL93157.1 Sensor protein FixL [Arcobacter porcinus]OCL96907.1 Sensor protein FixL [Aliarcobacter thereius]QEP40736.1 two-component system sensor histidine kinase [Arcobacter porcinus]
MKKYITILLDYFSSLKYSYKANFLVFIIAGGMFCIIFLSQLSLFVLKDDFDTLFDIRTKSLSKLETIKDTFRINIQSTLQDFQDKDLEYDQSLEVLILAKEIIEKNYSEYKTGFRNKNRLFIITFIKYFIISEQAYYKNELLKNSLIDNIDTLYLSIFNKIDLLEANSDKDYFKNINLDINEIDIFLSSLINYDLILAINEKRDTDKIFNTILIFSFISIFLVLFFTILLSFFITRHFKNVHTVQEKIVEDKTKELKELNSSLELKISQEVAKNRKKDIIMFQQARLASLGEMLNNIAHQWRQPLGSISMIIQSFRTKQKLNKLTDDFIEQKTKDALLLAQNMSNTLDDFKNFFDPNRQKIRFFIEDCILQSIELSKYSLSKENIKIKLNIKQNIELYSYYNELSHVILNILSNSKDALASLENKDDRIIKIITKAYKKYLIINILDNGGGVPKEILPKIFEPYFTTKYKSAGTGIGLYMSKMIIDKHLKGKINCKNINQFHKGNEYTFTSFTIKLPIEEEKNWKEI